MKTLFSEAMINELLKSKNFIPTGSFKVFTLLESEPDVVFTDGSYKAWRVVGRHGEMVECELVKLVEKTVWAYEPIVVGQ